MGRNTAYMNIQDGSHIISKRRTPKSDSDGTTSNTASQKEDNGSDEKSLKKQVEELKETVMKLRKDVAIKLNIMNSYIQTLRNQVF